MDITFLHGMHVFLSQSLQWLSLFVSLLISVSFSLPFLVTHLCSFALPRLPGSPFPHSGVGGSMREGDLGAENLGEQPLPTTYNSQTWQWPPALPQSPSQNSPPYSTGVADRAIMHSNGAIFRGVPQQLLSVQSGDPCPSHKVPPPCLPPRPHR